MTEAIELAEKNLERAKALMKATSESSFACDAVDQLILANEKILEILKTLARRP